MIGFVILLIYIFTRVEVYGNGCNPRKYDYESVVCVCNETYCDTWPPVQAPESGSYFMWTTSSNGLRADQSSGDFGSQKSEGLECILNPGKTYQTIQGFGGAFTDAAGINIVSLTPDVQESLLKSYFSPSGLEYVFGRVPIGGTDFSTHNYTYQDDSNDPSLDSFSLAPEDYKYKIPIIKQAQNYSTTPLKLIAAIWSSPAWMKTNNDLIGQGILKTEFYQALADYHVKFLDEYKKNGLNFYYMSTGNEPTMGLSTSNVLMDVGWVPTLQAEWIAANFGPTIQASYPEISIITGDDQRATVPYWLSTVLLNETAALYVKGLAVHWYYDKFLPVSLLQKTHELHPEKFILNTEACFMPTPTDPEPVALGSWPRAEAYAHDIMQDLNNWVVGWVDWNIALDPQGGPNWINNFVDSPIIVNKTANEFYKQPIYYILAHFSKFIPDGSRRVDISCNSDSKMEMVAFLRPDNNLSFIVLNREQQDQNFTLTIDQKSANITIPKKSISSILFNPDG